MGRHAVPSGGWLAAQVALPALVAAGGPAEDLITSGSYAALVAPADRPADALAVAITGDSQGVTGTVAHVLGAAAATTWSSPPVPPAGRGDSSWCPRTRPGSRSVPDNSSIAVATWPGSS